MGGVIKAGRVESGGPVFQFDDMSQAYLGKVKHQAEQIIAQARQEADRSRASAAAEGRQQAQVEADQKVRAQVDQKLNSLLPALTQAVQAIQAARLDWQNQWEKSGVELACAIAARIIRREVSRRPEITLDLIREALELAGSHEKLSLHLHPTDHAALADHLPKLLKELSRLGPVEVVADASQTRGGCKVCTEFGVIDQQVESQLSRIAEELLAS